MIMDITGIELTTGDNGEKCKGNGKYIDEEGKEIECCCDECDYMQCCFGEITKEICKKCTDKNCPNALKNITDYHRVRN